MIVSSPSTLTIADLLRGDLQLASPPNIYFQLKKIVDDPAKTAKDAAFVIENDAALAAKLLKIVNSAFYGFPAQVGSIARAITLIGTRELQNLVLGAVIVERFSDLPGQIFTIHDFWARNLRCALIARELDAQFGKHHAEVAFICGLLHNLGQLVFYRRIPVLAREVDLLLQAQAHLEVDDDVHTEQSVIGFDHFQVGAQLCQLWNLPEAIVESIRLHSFPDTISPYSDLAAMVRLANCLSRIENPYDALAVSALNLSPEQISFVLDKISDEFEVIFKLFYPSR
ncbi:HDOD domain-containing protein [Methylomonas koyamae]|uniref:Histidine kinase n=1 Tax=Methylomonas koyamae TaxID=702114 RepID=A0A177PHD2_9GAMM|nr:HDOD domain-containing protein [Methylomonas koyamae]ATG91836.1 histidine kinase [Methylomonas koyamae]OAI20936.1 histidine kinase [Methylomonas koyamae]OAI28780.1 histidine kinase [Methylomonas koyamae]